MSYIFLYLDSIMLYNILFGISLSGLLSLGVFKFLKYLSVRELKQSLKELESISERTEEIERLIDEHKELIEIFSNKLKK